MIQSFIARLYRMPLARGRRDRADARHSGAVTSCTKEAPMQQEMPTAIAAGARTKLPFRADHVGSLLRPPGLLRARADFADGQIDAEELRGVEDDAIREIGRASCRERV